MSPELLDVVSDVFLKDETDAAIVMSESEALKDCLDQLPPEKKQLVVLRYESGASFDSISSQVGWTKLLAKFDLERPAEEDSREPFGVETEAEAEKIAQSLSAIPLASAGDPPIYMSYGMPPARCRASQSRRSQKTQRLYCPSRANGDRPQEEDGSARSGIPFEVPWFRVKI